MKTLFNKQTADQPDVLKRYLSGSCTDEERALVEQWYNAWAAKGEDLLVEIDLEKIKQEMWENIGSPDAIVRPIRYKIALVAASVTLLLLVGLGVFIKNAYKGNEKQTWVKINAPGGSVVKAELPDGSKVWLNAGSTLAYQRDFGKKIRVVQLINGEGYFDVAHDPQKPFVVSTGEIKTQVLGTSFNIRAAAETKKITVTVLGGKVAVIKKNSAPIFLLPNQQADFNKATGEITRSSVIAQNTNGWIAGKFRFHNEELEVIASELQRRYNTSFEFETSKLRSIRFNTGFNATDNLNDILSDLAKTGDFRYRISGNHVTVFSAVDKEKKV
ncbi:ferric-dicitrate binding protein FerR, regulates iron transport through sigma-19 [Mucilaginibacter gossypiicola]|uniref:Ferric-dicitrate binding protein FerR, regulates iron transport through sigma-19 n=1 Tax=Mucilaginibacter gossypiicola TaxID=551995 RepID=A0A1H8BJ39_9SPHI|nr:FecR domain-containing protein [Mucilaginibacter gossypiicola]SEM82921.1 ferric-dicitrate binding protein FerR, regulates iron transport through sigma-19 [Mucilaginibacter gossypiicola]